MDEQNKSGNVDLTQNDDLGLIGYQVARGEFFAHTFEPSFTFSNYKVFVNSACVHKIPEKDYVQILVNPEQRKLAVRPCTENEKDSVRWCSSAERRAPRQISCKLFYAKVYDLMGWNLRDKYRMLGKLIQTEGESLFIFDLQTPEIFQGRTSENGKECMSKYPCFPENWRDQFGISTSEHKRLLINIFQESVVFGLKKDLKSIVDASNVGLAGDC